MNIVYESYRLGQGSLKKILKSWNFPTWLADPPLLKVKLELFLIATIFSFPDVEFSVRRGRQQQIIDIPRNEIVGGGCTLLIKEKISY